MSTLEPSALDFVHILFGDAMMQRSVEDSGSATSQRLLSGLGHASQSVSHRDQTEVAAAGQSNHVKPTVGVTSVIQC